MKPPPPPSPVGNLTQPDPPVAPDWAKDAIWYQAFPERFRNGCPESNPRPEDFGGEHLADWRITPWSMEWYARDNWETAHSPRFWTTVFHRRYGGDLVGLRQQLPYLQQLGINALYLNPIFQAASLHKYDATRFHHIDPALGPDREGDLRAIAAARETEDPATWIWTAADRYLLDLVADIHARGMRIILDGVLNHSGVRCFAFQDIVRNGKNSAYRDWYQVTQWHPDGRFDYASWDGGGVLPSFGRDQNTLHPGIKQYLFDITRRWMDPSGQGRPSEGVDGWRLDVAYCLPHPFWREWHAFVRDINPEAYTTAEIVGPAQPWLQPDQFSAVMNYEWTYPTIAFFTPHPDAIDAAEFQRRINILHDRHPPGTIHILQNLLDSHDTGRILTMFESHCPPFPDWEPYFNWARVANTPELITSCPGAPAKTALQLAVIWQMAGPGAPMIYYGTEVGMWGANDPCDRQPMLWNDIAHDDETLGYHGPLPQPRPRRPDRDLFAFYQRAIALRKAHPALRRGTFRWLPAPTNATLAFERHIGRDTLWCVIHKGDTPTHVQLPRPARDLWAGCDHPSGPLEIPPRQFRLVQLQPE